MPKTVNPIPLSVGKGVSNRTPESETPPGFVRVADNVDISTAGTTSRRLGYGVAAALPGAHSLWSDSRLGFALAADGGALYQFDATQELHTLVTGLSGAPVQYLYTPLGVYWSNGAHSGKVTESGVAAPWGVESPAPAYTLSAVAGVGGLDAGEYGVSLTFATDSHEESAAPTTQFVTVPQGGAIRITDVPAAQATNVVEACVYVTGSNSAQLFYAVSTAPGTAEVVVGAGYRGRALSTQFLAPLPPLLSPVLKSGRIFGLLQSLLIWSAPLYYGLYDPRNNYLGIHGERPTMLGAPESTQFVMYVGTSTATYVLHGTSIDDAHLAIAAHTGVQEGSMAMVAPDALGIEGVVAPVPVWVDAVGIPMAGTEEGLVPLHDKFVYPLYDRASAAFLRVGGQDRYLVSGRGGRPSGLVASDRVVARVYNNGGGA